MRRTAQGAPSSSGLARRPPPGLSRATSASRESLPLRPLLPTAHQPAPSAFMSQALQGLFTTARSPGQLDPHDLLTSPGPLQRHRPACAFSTGEASARPASSAWRVPLRPSFGSRSQVTSPQKPSPWPAQKRALLPFSLASIHTGTCQISFDCLPDSLTRKHHGGGFSLICCCILRLDRASAQKCLHSEFAKVTAAQMCSWPCPCPPWLA